MYYHKEYKAFTQHFMQHYFFYTPVFFLLLARF